MRAFFLPSDHVWGDTAFLDGSDVRHLAVVLKKKPGDEIDATDGEGNRYRARIESVTPDRVALRLLRKDARTERRTVLRLYQAVPRGQLIDDIIRKCAELGVESVIPLLTERTVPKFGEERGLKKVGRWERIALEASKRTGRTTSMSVHPAIRLENMPGALVAGSLRILPWELEDTNTLKSALQGGKPTDTVEVVIGPEGGFAVSEAEFLTGLGFQAVTLGQRILTVETAAVVTVGNIFYELD